MQTRNQVAIEFDNIEARNFADQLARQNAFAGADFDDVVGGLGVEGGDDALNDPALVQEVLAETLARLMKAHKNLIHRIYTIQQCRQDYAGLTRLEPEDLTI